MQITDCCQIYIYIYVYVYVYGYVYVYVYGFSYLSDFHFFKNSGPLQS